MARVLKRLVREVDGATALEYAILVVFIAIAMSFGAVLFGGGLRNLFTSTGAAINGAAAPGLPATPTP